MSVFRDEIDFDVTTDVFSYTRECLEWLAEVALIDAEFNEFEDACFDRNMRGSEVRGRDRPDPPISTLDMKSGVSTDSKSWCVAAKSMFAADINRRLAGAV